MLANEFAPRPMVIVFVLPADPGLGLDRPPPPVNLGGRELPGQSHQPRRAFLAASVTDQRDATGKLFHWKPWTRWRPPRFHATPCPLATPLWRNSNTRNGDDQAATIITIGSG